MTRGKSPKKLLEAVADEERLYFNDNLRRHSRLAVFLDLKGGRAMKSSKRSFVVVAALFAVLLVIAFTGREYSSTQCARRLSCTSHLSHG